MSEEQLREVTAEEAKMLTIEISNKIKEMYLDKVFGIHRGQAWLIVGRALNLQFRDYYGLSLAASKDGGE